MCWKVSIMNVCGPPNIESFFDKMRNLERKRIFYFNTSEAKPLNIF